MDWKLKRMKQQRQKQQSSVTVFSSYAQRDRALYDQLVTHLSPLRREGLIVQWSEQQILAGAHRTQQIKQALGSAQVILLLISADFLASATCEQQMQQALERHQRGEAEVVPLIVRPCDWQHTPFSHLQCLPRGGKPISAWDHPDDAFLLIAQELRQILAHLQFPSSPLSEVQRGNRAQLLKRVRTIWIQGLLERSLHQAAWIDLHLQEQPDALINPWRLQVPELDQEPHALPVGTSIAQVYDEAEGQLLLLGEPGAGKTTLLLHLARTLLDRAEGNERWPMPVVFHLSSWAQTRPPLGSWLRDELRIKYQVPRQVAERWVEQRQILPLLDGLDEVAKEARLACVQALIAYCSGDVSQRGIPLVVCCRSQEYEDLSLQVPFARAVSILPLTREQVDTYLGSIHGQLEGLRQALENDAELAALARRPLMLNIFTLAYQGSNAMNLLTESTQEQPLHSLFKTYIECMLKRRRLQLWTQEQYLHWLTFLAKQLDLRQQSLFTTADIRSTWLPGKQRRLYWLCLKQIGRLIFVFLTVACALWSFVLTGGLQRNSTGFAELLLWGGLGVTTFIVGPETADQDDVSDGTIRWHFIQELLISYLVLGLAAGLLVGWMYTLAFGLAMGVLAGLAILLVWGMGSVLVEMMRPMLLLFWFQRANCLPWNLASFLDDAAERLLLRKVGSSYLFVHRLLLEYFASLDEPTPTEPTPSKEKAEHEEDRQAAIENKLAPPGQE